MPRTLTDKQRRFVEAYLSNGRNASAAYRAAYPASLKWTVSAVTTQANRMLGHPDIVLTIAQATERAETATEAVIDRYAVTEANILAELALMAYSKDGLIFGENGPKMTAADKRAALVDLGKSLAMWTEVVKADQTVRNVVNGEPLPDDAWERQYGHGLPTGGSGPTH